MLHLEGWDLLIFGLSALVAITALARLITNRHRELENKFRGEWQAERARKQEAERAAKKKAKKDKAA